jgi:hypothetical protein
MYSNTPLPLCLPRPDHLRGTVRALALPCRPQTCPHRPCMNLITESATVGAAHLLLATGWARNEVSRGVNGVGSCSAAVETRRGRVCHAD